LERKNPELLILVTSFLKKLSCYSLNKDEMKSLNAADKLAPLLTTDNPGKIILNFTVIQVQLNFFYQETF
jgi:hypothetical protein